MGRRPDQSHRVSRRLAAAAVGVVFLLGCHHDDTTRSYNLPGPGTLRYDTVTELCWISTGGFSHSVELVPVHVCQKRGLV